VDKEQFIDALEGLKIDSPVGKLEMRACDHQVILPMFLGVTKMSPEYGVAISSDIYTLRGDEVMPSCKEIEAARAEQ
jgi:branched-chain amino acid transport system substrate-binding protein